MTDELTTLIAEALELDAASIDPGKLIADYEEWNSLAWLTIMSLLDERMGIQISAQEIRSCKTVSDFMTTVAAKAAAV